MTMFWEHRKSTEAVSTRSKRGDELDLCDHKEDPGSFNLPSRGPGRKSGRGHDRRHSMKRLERFQLFGCVELTSGEVITIHEAQLRLAASQCGDPEKFKALSETPASFRPITKDDVVHWYEAETRRDELLNRGEVDAVLTYPSLGITPGTVLMDPNMHPAYRLRYQH